MLTCKHPDNLYCTECGSGTVHYWPEMDNWDALSEEEKDKLIVCACCHKEIEEEEYDG